MFSLSFLGAEPRYIRRARAYLQEARMSVLEHTIAAEHYQASAAMYAERARRLEEEIAQWEVHKNGAELLEAMPDTASNAAVQNRVEGVKHSRHKAELGVGSSVGIVRAA